MPDFIKMKIQIRVQSLQRPTDGGSNVGVDVVVGYVGVVVGNRKEPCAGKSLFREKKADGNFRKIFRNFRGLNNPFSDDADDDDNAATINDDDDSDDADDANDANDADDAGAINDDDISISAKK